MAPAQPLSFDSQRMPKLSVAFNASETSAGVLVYEILVFDGSRQWSVNRRYKDFCKLREELKGHSELAWGLAPLPPKSFFRRRLSERFVDRRYASLEAWLQGLLAQDATCASSPELLAFLLPVSCPVVEELKARMVSSTVSTKAASSSSLISE